MEPDPKNMDMVKGILRSQLLIIYGGGEGRVPKMENHR